MRKPDSDPVSSTSVRLGKNSNNGATTLCAAASRQRRCFTAFRWIRSPSVSHTTPFRKLSTHCNPDVLPEEARSTLRCASNLYEPSAGTTRQTILPTSSVVNKAPSLSTATSTGLPIASSLSLMNPDRMSSGSPAGMPSAKGTKITL